MIKLRYKLPHSDGTEQTEHPIEVEGDSATIGRDKGCEIRIQQPYVSKRHARILRGVVVVDLGSSNGTFVGGQRVHEATLLQGDKRVVLGKDDVIIELEDTEAELGFDATLSSGDDVARERLAAQVERYRSQNVELQLRVEDLERALAAAREGTAPEARVQDLHEQMDALRIENVELQRRLETLKIELERQAKVANEGVQAKLLQDEVERLRRRGDDAERRAKVAEQRAQELQAAADPAQFRAQLTQIETQLREQRAATEKARTEAERGRRAEVDLAAARKEVEALQAQIARAQAPVTPAPTPPQSEGGLMESMRALLAENGKLKKRVTELESTLVKGSKGAVTDELFVRLQAENEDLRRRLKAVELGRVPAQGNGDSAARVAELERRCAEAVQRNGELERQVHDLQRARPVPARAPSAGPGGATTAMFLAALAKQDAPDRKQARALPVDQFTMTEVFRCLREVERVVTRQAGDFIQLYDNATVMPGTERENLRSRLHDLFADPDDASARERVIEYTNLIGQWLAASVQAPKLAVAKLSEELRQRLVKVDALLPKKARAELALPAPARESQQDKHWREALEDPRKLSADLIEDRVTKLAREVAEELVARGIQTPK